MKNAKLCFWLALLFIELTALLMYIAVLLGALFVKRDFGDAAFFGIGGYIVFRTLAATSKRLEMALVNNLNEKT